MFKKLCIVTIACLALAGALVFRVAAGQPKSPRGIPQSVPGPPPANVLVIVADDIGVDQIECYEQNYVYTPPVQHPRPCTPTLNALAQNAVRFTNAWSNPLCSPTRSQIMTGKRTSNTGIGVALSGFLPGLDEDTFTIGDLVEFDAAVGKWHLASPNQWPGQPTHATNLGFRYFRGSFANIGDYNSWIRCDSEVGTCQTEMGYSTTVITNDAIALMNTLEAESDNEPWLLYVAYHSTHQPWACPPSTLCAGGCEGTDWCATCTASGDSIRNTRAMTQAMDAEIGRLLINRPPNTAVIFIGDNGTPNKASAPPFYSMPPHDKGTVYQQGINVPLIIQSPLESPPAGVSNRLVSATDLFATIATFLGETFAVPEDPYRDSFTLASHVDGRYCQTPCISIERQYVYSEVFYPTFIPVNGAPPCDFLAQFHNRALRNATHKLIEKVATNGGVTEEFYRLYDVDVGGPAPQDPAQLDGQQPDDPLASAFETANLNSMEYADDWTPEDTAAYAELTAELAANYPRLPTGTQVPVPAAIVTSVSRDFSVACSSPSAPACDDDPVHVGFSTIPTGTRKARAFFEFNLSAADPHDESWGLNVTLKVQAGSNLPKSRVVRVLATDGIVDVSNLACASLYDASDEMVAFAADQSNWVAGSRSIPLNTAGVAAVRTALGPGSDGRFSVALQFSNESCSTDRLTLSTLVCGQPSPHFLELNWIPSEKPARAEASLRNAVRQNHPNPFNPSTTIAYAVQERALVTLCVYDVAGALVRTLVREEQPPGADYKVVWNGRDAAGRKVASGMYLYRLTIGDHTESKKMLMLK